MAKPYASIKINTNQRGILAVHQNMSDAQRHENTKIKPTEIEEAEQWEDELIDPAGKITQT